jgi:hypothetical protein
LSGARAVQKIILEDYPNASISVSIVWIKMLPSDNASTAKKAAQTIVDTRVRHFYDPKEKVGKIIAQSLGEPSKTAWDMYLFYAAENTWNREPPQPIAWAHQLSNTWLDHYHYGDNLETELHSIAERLLLTLRR